MTSNEVRLYAAFLKIAGLHITTQSTSRRHVQAIDDALTAITDPEYREQLLEVRAGIVNKWGDGQVGQPNHRMPKPIPVGVWMRTRAQKQKTFHMLQVAAELVLGGERSMGKLMTRTICSVGHGKYRLVNQPQFTRWMIELGIAEPRGNGIYAPGPCAQKIWCMRWSEVSAVLEDYAEERRRRRRGPRSPFATAA